MYNPPNKDFNILLGAMSPKDNSLGGGAPCPCPLCRRLCSSSSAEILSYWPIFPASKICLEKRAAAGSEEQTLPEVKISVHIDKIEVGYCACNSRYFYYNYWKTPPKKIKKGGGGFQSRTKKIIELILTRAN